MDSGMTSEKLRDLAILPGRRLGCIVTTTLAAPAFMGAALVIFVWDQEAGWNQTTLEVVSNWHSKDRKNILSVIFYSR